MILPIHLPKKPRAKAIHTTNVERNVQRRRTDTFESIDWLALWALSLGLSAVVLAALAFYGAGDPIGASMILFGTAIIIAMVLGFSTAPVDTANDTE